MIRKEQLMFTWTLSVISTEPHLSSADWNLFCVSGSAIRCYSCKDYTASCSKQRDCSYDDACLTLNERGTPLLYTSASVHQYTCTITTESVGFWLAKTPSLINLAANTSCPVLIRSFSVHEFFCWDSAVCPAGGMTYRQCLKYSDCEYSRLAQMFPQVTAFLSASYEASHLKCDSAGHRQ